AFNPHNKLDYKSSAKKIIDHIYGGVELAKKHSLPDPIIDFIKTHQGTATVHYFFRLYAKENEDGQSERTEFQYPGPRPQTKEQVILMMSDAIEAASRSLTEYSENSIDKLVEGIVNTQLNEGQYEEADITFKEVFEAKEIIKEKLHTIYHARIAYPKEVGKE
ncbi:MAG: hydrolase, partial [Bacteroidales bacterium]|nr:hydrolase [Bacteroidales bacterium]